MGPKKYMDFQISTPYMRTPLNGIPGTKEKREYVTITCPRCHQKFCEMALDNLATHRARNCLEHIRHCQAYTDHQIQSHQDNGSVAEPNAADAGDSSRVALLEKKCEALQSDLDKERAHVVAIQIQLDDANRTIHEMASFADAVQGELAGLETGISMYSASRSSNVPSGALVGVGVTAHGITLPNDELTFAREFIRRSIASDSLLRQMPPAKRCALQLLDVYSHKDGASVEQFELFKKAFASTGVAAAMGVVHRVFEGEVDGVLVHATNQLLELERQIPDMAERAKSTEAEDALCTMHLHNACRRMGVTPLSKAGFSSLYLGEYTEVRKRFHGYKCVRREDVVTFLSKEPQGKLFWSSLCTRSGLPQVPYDSATFQIEHILNDAFGGADHYLNYMVLFRVLNNAAEFKYGPGECKMITIGRHKFNFVQRFCKWERREGGCRPGDDFLNIESEFYALPAVSITGARAAGRQLSLSEATGGKRKRS